MLDMFKILNPLWLIENFFTLRLSLGGDDPPPAPTNQTVTQVSIPEYIRPSVERLIGKTEALTDINQNPYRAYGGQRIADFSPMQNRAFNDVANMQTSSQLGAASNLAGGAGLGAFGLAGQMGNAGNNYYGMATNPYATQAFMNPYIQASLSPQLDEMRRQYGITGTQQQGNATRAGAFGGSREALMAAENNRNMNTAMNQTIGQGYDKAFQAAQQAQQFGANLGLQGQQGALQGYGLANTAAGTLGQLGQTQFGQRQAINQAQQNVGTIQQAQAQQGLDQRYQDFLKQQNYPYQQLAFMSDMQRGLPLSQSATSMYQAPPSMVSQLGGLGMAGLGIYGASGGFKGNKEGGAIKEYKAGGLAAVDGYAPGGKIDLKSEEELRAIITNPRSNPLEVAFAEEQLMLRNRMKNNPQTAEIMGQPRAGIGAIATGDMVPEGEPMLAGGGIIAFKSGNKVEEKPSETEAIKARILSLSDELLKGNPFQKSEENQRKIDEAIAARRERMPYDVLTSAGFGAMAGTSPHALTNFGLGGQQGLKTAQQIEAENAADRKLAMQNATEQEKAEFARKSGILNNMQTTYGQMLNKELGLKQIEATKAGTDATRMAGVMQRDMAAAAVAHNAIYKEILKDLYAKEKLSPVKSSPEELDAIASTMAINRLPEKYKQYYPSVSNAAPAKPGAAPSASPALASAPSQPKLNKYQLGVGQKQLTAKEEEALKWANDPANANNPQSATIRQLLTMGS
jgi:hypothetical protein